MDASCRYQAADGFFQHASIYVFPHRKGETLEPWRLSRTFPPGAVSAIRRRRTTGMVMDSGDTVPGAVPWTVSRRFRENTVPTLSCAEERRSLSGITMDSGEDASHINLAISRVLCSSVCEIWFPDAVFWAVLASASWSRTCSCTSQPGTDLSRIALRRRTSRLVMISWIVFPAGQICCAENSGAAVEACAGNYGQILAASILSFGCRGLIGRVMEYWISLVLSRYCRP